MESKKVRMNITMPSHLLEYIDEQVELYGLTRSSAIGIMVKSYMQQEQSMSSVETVKLFLEKLEAMQAQNIMKDGNKNE